ncbi:MAG: septum formation initiator family protein [Eubacterium sp.]|nr:septum formation initiator family protein [Eubacterium sp.]
MRADRRRKKKNSRQFNQRFKRRFLTSRSAIIWVFTIIIFAGMAVGFYKIEQRVAGYQETIDELSTEIRNLKQTNRQLEDEMENVNSDEYIEKMARERLGMVKEGEFILKQSKEADQDED